MADDPKSFTTPQQIAEAGERIYAERYKASLEKEKPGMFAAIDVLTGNVYVAQFPEEALDSAKKQASTGLFHLVRIGSAGAYRVSHLLHAVVR